MTVGKRLLQIFPVPFVVILFFLPAASGVYLFADDHIYFSWSLAGEFQPMNNFLLRDGRPVTSLVFWFFTNSFDSFVGFSFLRAFAALATCMLALSLQQEFRRVGAGPWLSGISALAVTTHPAFAIYVGWTVCFLYPLAAIFALEAGRLVAKVTEAGDTLAGRISLLLLAAFLIVLSLSIYQITAYFFLVPLATRLFDTRFQDNARGGFFTRSLAVAKNPLLGALVAVVALAAYIFLVGYLKSTFLDQANQLGSRPLAQLPGLAVFAELLRIHSGRLYPGWLYFLGPVWRAPATLLFGGAILLGIGVQRRIFFSGTVLPRTLLLLAMFAATFVSLAFIAQETTPWRLYPGSYAMFVVLLVIALSYGRDPANGGLMPWISTTCSLVLAVSILSGFHFFRTGLVEPNVRETEKIRPYMEAFPPDKCRLLVLGAPEWYHFPLKGLYEYTFRESGVAGTFPRHGFRSLYGHVHGRDAVDQTKTFVVVNYLPPAGLSEATGTSVLDEGMGPGYVLGNPPPELSVLHQTFGECIRLNDYTLYSRKYGYLVNTFETWYYSPILGHIKPVLDDAESVTLQSYPHGSLVLPKNPDNRWIWSEERDKWIRIEELDQGNGD